MTPKLAGCDAMMMERAVLVTGIPNRASYPGMRCRSAEWCGSDAMRCSRAFYDVWIGECRHKIRSGLSQTANVAVLGKDLATIRRGAVLLRPVARRFWCDAVRCCCAAMIVLLCGIGAVLLVLH